MFTDAYSFVAPNLQAAQSRLKFITTITSMEHKMENRPALSILIQNNIMKGITPHCDSNFFRGPRW